ncbi:hypothetical protein DSM100688_0421 [Bifidobacterium ramosum]|uniref:Uncharacterized protein n=1 Tax=Bifidobacterium ramosum TaxID=1798158 RepID=A0A6L4X2W2_9BIFI|nr:hypothetical protein [Bifidobacterium ramosum]KAB8289341.1 hypothetical protein DSM100688_0421 [Bifidobacterium ramosum]NEG71039.1 hypothetical protein [Bifidobacterium ramosum]
MITVVYGRHMSGFRRPSEPNPGKPRAGSSARSTHSGGRRSHPYTVALAVFALALLWLLSHEGCAHPVGNLIASLVGFGFVPLRLLALWEADRE